MLTEEQRQHLRLAADRSLAPTIVQDHRTGEVLMLAWSSEESLARTLEGGEAVFHSRSRDELWHKGATSGNTQRVVDVRLDCDGDALLVLVEPSGPACHTGQRSCFHRRVPGAPGLPSPVAPALADGAAGAAT